jgi:hypothetical protein
MVGGNNLLTPLCGKRGDGMKKEIQAINKNKSLLNAIKSLVQIKQEADEAGMTLKDYMQKNNLMPDKNSPAVKMIMNLHNRFFNSQGKTN